MNRTNIVLFPEQTESLLKILRSTRSHNAEIRSLIQTLDENSKSDELDRARGEVVMNGLSDSEWDQDGYPAVSAGDDPGAYVQIWRWVPDGDLPDDIQRKFKIGEYAEEESI